MNTNNNMNSNLRQHIPITYIIKDVLVLFFYRIGSFIPVPRSLRMEHLRYNISAWADYRLRFSNDKYIEHQSALSNLLYGKRYYADYNSCEVIALYNALISIDDTNADFPGLLEVFEHRGITCLGAFGTSPFAIVRYLKKKGYNVNIYKYLHLSRIYGKDIEPFDTYIVMFYNNVNSIRDMIHTMCITREAAHYRIHNDYEGSKCYPTLEAAISGYKQGRSRPVIIIGIEKG